VAVSLSVSCIAFSSALSRFCSPRSLRDIYFIFSSLYIPYPTISLSSSGPSGLGGIKEPSVK
jgi:hypothetical protein